MGKIKNIKEWGLALLLALLFTILIKQLFYQSYLVSTDKMMGSLQNGDRVLVNKSAYGSRTPVTVLSFPFFDNLYSELLTLKPNRLPGFTEPKKGDIFAYNSPSVIVKPLDKKRIDFSRCVALPGDTIYIKNKKLYVNNRYQKYPNQCLFSYRLVAENGLIDSSWFQKYNIRGGEMVSEIGIYDIPLSLLQEAQANKDPYVKFIRELQKFSNTKQEGIFPPFDEYNWNNDFFGSLVIPYKGQTIGLDSKSIGLYAHIIESYEGNKLRVVNNEVEVNGALCTTYTFEQDYFFLLDDNRDYALDSRHWGFLPKSHLIGRVDLIWLAQLNKQIWPIWENVFQRPQ